jgi:hypothetical protein
MIYKLTYTLIKSKLTFANVTYWFTCVKVYDKITIVYLRKICDHLQAWLRSGR